MRTAGAGLVGSRGQDARISVVEVCLGLARREARGIDRRRARQHAISLQQSRLAAGERAHPVHVVLGAHGGGPHPTERTARAAHRDLDRSGGPRLADAREGVAGRREHREAGQLLVASQSCGRAFGGVGVAAPHGDGELGIASRRRGSTRRGAQLVAEDRERRLRGGRQRSVRARGSRLAGDPGEPERDDRHRHQDDEGEEEDQSGSKAHGSVNPIGNFGWPGRCVEHSASSAPDSAGRLTPSAAPRSRIHPLPRYRVQRRRRGASAPDPT